MAYTYLAPRRSAQILQNRANQCLNLSLTLGRYVPREVIENTQEIEYEPKKKDKIRNVWLRDIVKQLDPWAKDEIANLIAATSERWIAQTEKASRFSLRLLSPMIVGLGGKGVLEFGLTLHPVTGLPYIPGSALKGLCRNYALLNIASLARIKMESTALEKFDEELIEGKIDTDAALMYRAIFGSQSKAGACVFHDAVLSSPPEVKRPLFRLDVMTPHFGEYYKSTGKESPNDADKPNPIIFLTVDAGWEFLFAIGLRTAYASERELAKTAHHWLSDALYAFGIGAKTAAGYGVFQKAK